MHLSVHPARGARARRLHSVLVMLIPVCRFALSAPPPEIAPEVGANLPEEQSGLLALLRRCHSRGAAAVLCSGRELRSKGQGRSLVERISTFGPIDDLPPSVMRQVMVPFLRVRTGEQTNSPCKFRIRFCGIRSRLTRHEEGLNLHALQSEPKTPCTPPGYDNRTF